MAKSIQGKIQTSSKVVPMIYAYTTPGITYHDGYIKIGYTEQDVDDRIYQQTHTAGVKAKKEWQGTATFDDGTGDTFRDSDFHAYLRKLGVKQPQDEGNEYFDPEDRNEWFHISAAASRSHFFEFRSNRGIVGDVHEVIAYRLRNEQAEAVRQTVAYRKDHEGAEFLWNAKPRFGKTLSVYDFIQQIKAQRVLIVTNRPAIANSWYADYEKFLGRQSGYFFVSNVDGIKERPLVLSYSAYDKTVKSLAKDPENNQQMGLIEFVSLQDLKGSIYFGGPYEKLKEIKHLQWDVLVIDEAHEGVDTYKTDVAFDQIKRSFTLHLSGTPFKALANDKFPDQAIFNWTYADEQRSKHSWTGTGENPYSTLPQLNMFTYQMSEIIRSELSRGLELNGETEEYAFDLNEFFATDENKRFIHDSSVDKFLDALTSQEKFPFSTPELRDELKHTFWMLNRVNSAEALARKLEKHPIFKDYKVVLAAGSGRIDDEEENRKSYDKVVDAIRKYDKTITLSVGQLTTGITIPEWTAVLMLSNIKSPALYMQAAFRAQNPCLFHTKTGSYRKKNAYVFDFDPARTLVIFEQFANDLSQDTAAGHGDIEKRKAHIRELLNFFPVIGEDDKGEMIPLDAEKVLSIPRKIKSQEVVRRGFMSDFLFQNITNVFHAPPEVFDILENFPPVAEPAKKKIDSTAARELSVDDSGEVQVPDEKVIGVDSEIFGQKLYNDLSDQMENALDYVKTSQEGQKASAVEDFKQKFHQQAVEPVIAQMKDHYGSDMKRSDEKQVERILTVEADRKIDKSFDEYNIQKKTIEQERKEALENRHKEGKTSQQINQEFDQKQKDAVEQLQQNLQNTIEEFAKEKTKEAIKAVETRKEERKRDTIEDSIKDHLRGFTRTIPSFLMAYGDDGVTLITFDQVIPDGVFKEVTSITLDQFRFLRDGGDYVDQATGETKHFDGHLFEPVVFDDSVKEFMRLRTALANYFDEQMTEDIFDYVPPQKTNQIFTPKVMVKKMVDMLEQENPGCFDMPDKTFIDLYMKSGLYITEIVKRLYQSNELKRLYPDPKARLKHIFEKQVYGLAPTEIIYKIATNFILGFDKDVEIKNHNFRQVDALPYAKEGKLDELLDQLFGDK